MTGGTFTHVPPSGYAPEMSAVAADLLVLVDCACYVCCTRHGVSWKGEAALRRRIV